MRIGVSRSDTRIVYGSGATFRYQYRIHGSGVTFRHQDIMRIRVSRSDTRIVYEERSFTYQHERNKDNESWILLRFSDLMNLFPKWIWYGGLRPHGCTWHYYQWFLYLLLLPIEYCSWFYDIIWYILFSILSWPMIPTQYLCLYWPLLVFIFLLIVECSKRTVVFNSTATLASLHYTGFQGELMLLAWTGSSSSCLDALNFWHGIAFYLF